LSKVALKSVSLATAHAQLERIQADGWKVVAVECLVDPAFSHATIYAIKRIGSFTTALTEEIAPAVVITAAIEPFHTEGSNPWRPNGKHTVAHTCIDGPGTPN
jgi:hypothetical protein